MKKRRFTYGWMMVVYSAVLFFFYAGISTDGLNVTVPAFVAERGWDYSTVLALATPAGWVGLIGIAIFSQVVNKKGTRFTIILTTICTGVVCFMYGFAPSIPVYAIAIMLACFFSNAFGCVTTGSLIAGWFPRKRGYALGWGSMGLPIATAIFVPGFGLLIAKLGLGGAFVVLGILHIIVAVIAIVWVKDTPEEVGLFPDGDERDANEARRIAEEMASYQSDWTVARLMKNKTVWVMSICYGLLFFVTVGLVSQMVTRLIGLGYTQATALGLLSFASVAGIIGSYIWGLLDIKITTKKTTVIFCLWYALAIIVLLAAKNSFAGTVIGCGMAGVGIGGIGNLQPSMLAQVFGRFDYAAASRVVNVIVGFLRVSSFAVVAIAIKLTGSVDGSYIILIGACVVSLILAIIMDDSLIGKKG